MMPETEQSIRPIRVRVSENWKRFIIFCQNQYPDGQVCVKMANGMPQELVTEYTKRRVRFDRPEPQPPVSFSEKEK